MGVAEDWHSVNRVRLKLATEGLWHPTRDDIREVGRVRIKHDLAKQRDDEKYSDYLDRICAALDVLQVKKINEGDGHEQEKEE